MCLGIPGEVIEVLVDQPQLAKVDVAGVKRNINIGLVEEEGVAPGEWVLIHVGFAMSKIDEQEARSSLEFLESMGQAYRDELDRDLALVAVIVRAQRIRQARARDGDGHGNVTAGEASVRVEGARDRLVLL